MAKPDLLNENKNLAVWLKEEEGDVVLSISKDGDYLGSIRDYDGVLGIKKKWFVYILKTKGYGRKNKGDIKYYVGKTWDLEKRLKEHKYHIGSKFTTKYKYAPISIEYFEVLDTESEALDREQKIKGWSRDKKIAEIETFKENNSEHPLISSGILTTKGI